MTTTTKQALAITCALTLNSALTGCTLPKGADTFQPQTLPVWVVNHNARAQADTPAIEFTAQNWWETANDPILTELIVTAIGDNANARAAAARTAAAAAQLNLANAQRQPQVGVQGQLDRQQLSRFYYVPPSFAGRPLSIGQATLNAQWNIDLWGQQQKAIEAAAGQAKAAAADQAMATLQLSTQIARVYVQLRHLKAEHIYLENIRQLQTQTLNLQNTRRTLGLDNGTGLDQASDALSQTQMAIEQAQGMQARLVTALEALIGDPAVTSKAMDRLPASLPAPLLNYRIKQPIALSLLSRRPDLVGERFRVEAAAAEVEVTRLSLLPNINLGGYVGRQSIGFSNLSDPGSGVALLSGAVQFPVFDAGRIRFATEARRAQFDALKAGYEAAVSTAAQEVINGVLLIQQYEREVTAQQQRSDALQNQLLRAQARYRAGIDPILPSLELNVAGHYQQLRMMDLQLRILGNQIDLVTALGGGFDINSLTSQGQGS